MVEWLVKLTMVQLEAASDYGAISLRRVTDAYYGLCYGSRRADRAIDATANDSLQIGHNVMSEERPPQATSAKRR